MNKFRIIGHAMQKWHGFFSMEQIVTDTKLSKKTVRDNLCVFCKEKLIKKISQKRICTDGPTQFSTIYRIVDSKGLAARIGPKQFENTTQDKLWFVMRKLKFFTLRDIVVTSGVKRQTARWYFKALRNIGAIARLGKGGPGVEWRLVRDTGPRRPYLEKTKRRTGETERGGE